MTRTIIASLVALSIIGGIATAASAHSAKPKPQAAAEQPFSPAEFWEQQQNRGN